MKNPFNEQTYRENRRRPVREVHTDSHRAFRGVIQQVEALTEADVERDVGLPREKLRLRELIAWRARHIYRHGKFIRRWLASRRDIYMPKIEFSVILESTAPRAPGGVAFTMTKATSRKLGTRARVNVVGTLNGYPFRNSMFPTGTGTHYMVVNKEIRRAIGVGVGDRVKVVLEVDTEPRTVLVPIDLRKALARSKPARAAFERLPPSHQREYVDYVAEAKRPETRARRIEQTLARLAELQAAKAPARAKKTKT